jgi:DNA-binding PucR family transcriptional regulator
MRARAGSAAPHLLSTARSGWRTAAGFRTARPVLVLAAAAAIPGGRRAAAGRGLRRTLIEWYGSQNAREAVTNVLEPLDRLGGKKAEEAIKTLHVFLDARGSLSRAAEVLHLHRNAVAYRINRIFSRLEVDPEDPDDWLLLELACRARRLG